jgi:hypothetical protein
MGAHLIDGQFQSDKYPTTPRGKVPLSVRDTSAQDLLWEYAQRHRAVDAEFADDLEAALRQAGYVPTRRGTMTREEYCVVETALNWAESHSPPPLTWGESSKEHEKELHEAAERLRKSRSAARA